MLTVFISYCRQNEKNVIALSEEINALDYTVWRDQKLSGGQVWWNEILESVRQCDVFVFALSPESLNSIACKREYVYADMLGKSILPILITQGVSTKLLPPELSKVQFVDYRSSDRKASLSLAKALHSIAPSGQLPSPLPSPPEIPLSYLGSLSEKIKSVSKLSEEEQSSLLFQIKQGLNEDENSEEAYALLALLRKRRDLLASIAEVIDELLKTQKPRRKNSRRAKPKAKQNKVGCALSFSLGGILGLAIGALILFWFLSQLRSESDYPPTIYPDYNPSFESPDSSEF